MADGSLVHPTALVESTQVGSGTRVWAFVHILEGAVVGRDCKIGDYCFIEGGATIGDRVTIKNGCMIWHGVSVGSDVFIGPNVVFTNDPRPRTHLHTGPDEWERTLVDNGASIGANSTVLSGIRMGTNCLVGAGSVVTRDVPAHALVRGNPAHQVGWVCHCGKTLTLDLVCPGCMRRFKLTDGQLISTSSDQP